MSQEKPATKKAANPRVSKDERAFTLQNLTPKQPLCYIQDNIGSWVINRIRENVCFNEEIVKHTDGEHYCLFHLPTKDKDIGKFEEIFKARLTAVEEKLTAIEDLPETEQEASRKSIIYDFRYIYFPSEVDFSKYKFLTAANFKSATFTSDADFNSVSFASIANFNSVSFVSIADFNSVNFASTADFSSVNFGSDTFFNSVNFGSDTDFSSTSFASFQRPDPKAADVLTKLLVTLETILAPLQAALLALAIRRKFMR